MTHAYYHAQSSARTFGGVPEDYLAIHDWLVLICTVKAWQEWVSARRSAFASLHLPDLRQGRAAVRGRER